MTTDDLLRDWTVLDEGGSGRWLYARLVSPGVWVCVRIDDMVEACGGEADFYFAVDVLVVDLNQAAQCGNLAGALQCCGAEEWIDSMPDENKPLALVECCVSYGAYSPMWQGGSGEIDQSDPDWRFNVPSDSDPVFVRLLREAIEWATENTLDADSREHLLDTTIVNKIGQTAREYAGGSESLWDSLRRIQADPDASDEQKLVLRMYSKAGQTLGAGPVPSDLCERDE